MRHTEIALRGPVTTVVVFVALALVGLIAARLLLAKPMPQQPGSAPSSFLTAVKINLLNPAPYLFWSTVGGTYLAQNTPTEGAVFAILFLATLAITKFIMALSIKMLGDRFSDRLIDHALKLLAVLLMIFAARLLFNAFGAN